MQVFMSEINIKVLYFAAAKEAIGFNDEMIKFTHAPTLSQLQAELYSRYPQLEPLKPYLRWALNQSFVEDENTLLSDLDEVAIIPPISGG